MLKKYFILSLSFLLDSYKDHFKQCHYSSWLFLCICAWRRIDFTIFSHSQQCNHHCSQQKYTRQVKDTLWFSKVKRTENYISIISFIAAIISRLSTNRHLYPHETHCLILWMELILKLNLTCHHEWSALQDMKKYMKKSSKCSNWN